jgi:hypothetical protein
MLTRRGSTAPNVLQEEKLVAPVDLQIEQGLGGKAAP